MLARFVVTVTPAGGALSGVPVAVGVGVGVGVGVAVGVGGGVGVEATPLPPPPHAAVASIAALAISNFVNCFVLMAVLPKCLTKIRWGCVESLNLMCDDRHLMIS